MYIQEERSRRIVGISGLPAERYPASLPLSVTTIKCTLGYTVCHHLIDNMRRQEE